MLSKCGDSTKIVYPLFQEGDGGLIPTSPLQLFVGGISVGLAIELNELWHSRLPTIKNIGIKKCFGAEYGNRWYAAALWSAPISPTYVRKPYLELRRFAICPDAPKNTASRMMSIMVRSLKKEFSRVEKLISYQDTDVHTGTIYKASGWTARGHTKGGENTWSRPNQNRIRTSDQAAGDKIRWELDV